MVLYIHNARAVSAARWGNLNERTLACSGSDVKAGNLGVDEGLDRGLVHLGPVISENGRVPTPGGRNRVPARDTEHQRQRNRVPRTSRRKKLR